MIRGRAGPLQVRSPSSATVRDLQRQFPHREIRLVERPEGPGSNGKVNTLIQPSSHAREQLVLEAMHLTLVSQSPDRFIRFSLTVQCLPGTH